MGLVLKIWCSNLKTYLNEQAVGGEKFRRMIFRASCVLMLCCVLPALVCLFLVLCCSVEVILVGFNTVSSDLFR